VDSQERFNLFLSYLQDPTSLSPEDRRGIYDRLSLAPQIYDRPLPAQIAFPHFPLRLSVEQEFSQGPLRVYCGGEFNPDQLIENHSWCIRVMQSGIFRQGQVRARVNNNSRQTLTVLHLEGFIRDLAACLQSARIFGIENIVRSNEQIRKAEAKNYIKELDRAIANLFAIGAERLAQKQKIMPIVDKLIDIKWDIKRNRHHLSNGFIEGLKKDSNTYNIPITLAFIFQLHMENIKRDPLSERIKELMTYFDYQVNSAGIKKALQRSSLF
jgi:hypothetical protein